MADAEVRGADQLEALGKRLKAAGAKDLRKQLLAALRAAGKPLVQEVKASALATLPSHGGLATLVAGSKFAMRNKLSGQNVGMRVEGTNANAKGLQAIDKGTVRHPVYGRGPWIAQSITPGFFSKPMEAGADHVRAAASRAIAEVAAKLD